MSDDGSSPTASHGGQQSPSVDARPRPQYGEYATREEQQARIQRPEVTEALDAGVTPARTPAVHAGAPAAAVAGPRTRGAQIDRIVTFGLLAYGFVNVFFNIAQLWNFSSFAAQFAETLKLSATFSSNAASAIWGPAAAVTLGVAWALTAIVAVRRMRSAKTAFWVPLVGFFIGVGVSAIFIYLGFHSDPDFWSALTGFFRI